MNGRLEIWIRDSAEAHGARVGAAGRLLISLLYSVNYVHDVKTRENRCMDVEIGRRSASCDSAATLGSKLRDPSHERLGQSPAGLQLLRLLPARGANACDRGANVGGGGARDFDGAQSGAKINVGARVRIKTTGRGGNGSGRRC